MAKQEVALQESNQLPAFLVGHKGPTGVEGLDKDDVTLPRIKLGQGTSKEVKDKAVQYGDIFLNITQGVLAEAGKPLEFVVIARSKEYILWRPRKDNGGGILARAHAVETPDGIRYAWDKPNTSYDVKLEGVVPVTWNIGTYVDEDGTDEWGSENPADKTSGKAATVHYNYVVALPGHNNMVAAFSLSRTAVKPAKIFNSLIGMLPNIPLWGRKFKVKSVDESKNGNDYKNWGFTPDGYVAEGDFPLYDQLAKTFAEIKYSVDDASDETELDERV